MRERSNDEIEIGNVEIERETKFIPAVAAAAEKSYVKSKSVNKRKM